ncbi:hypothetical protein AY599_24645 [Leptolyngbya valderiana BDU 20041]|nr:hypothetical protein AY599_24645 [Leptolyngbya valderiana BDU 20041]
MVSQETNHIGLFLGALSLLIGCSEGPPESAAAPGDTVAESVIESEATDSPTPGDRLTAYRIRLDADRGLNEDGGWAAPMNTPARVDVDQPFRLRVEVEAGERNQARVFSLQYRRQDGDWQPLLAEDFPYPSKVIEGQLGTADSPVSTGWRIVSGEADFQRLPDPTLGIASGAAPFRAWVETDIEWTPSELALGVRIPAGSTSAFGLVFEDLGGGQYRVLELLPPDRVRVVHVDAAGRETLAEAAAEIATDRWLELTIELTETAGAAELGDEVLIDWPRTASTTARPRLGIELPAGSAVQLDHWALETDASTPPASIVSSPTFAHGAATTDRLEQSSLPFAPGTGLSLRTRTPEWTASRQHGEWSVPIVIRRFADQAAMKEEDDRFEFRLVDAQGQPVPSEFIPTVQLDVPAGHLGGTFVETPMRLGPWQTDTGDLFFIMEPSETWNRPMMLRSEDGGRSWREADGEGRPSTGDLEGVATAYAGGRIHVLHQISERVLYHAFDPSLNGGTWVIRDEPVATPPTPPTQVTDLAVRTDGSIVAVYGAGLGLKYSVRSPEGDWDAGHDVAGPASTVLSGPTVVLGRDDVVHLANTASNGTAWVRRIHPDVGASEAILVADSLGTEESDVGALLPLVTLDEGRVLVLIHRARDGRLYERRSSDNGSWSEPALVSNRVVIQSAVDSDQVGADVVTVDEALHVLFIEAGTGVLFHVVGVDGHWSPPRAVVTGANVQWVRGQVLQSNEGLRSYGFVYDAGSNGGSGRNRFMTIPLQSAADPIRKE